MTRCASRASFARLSPSDPNALRSSCQPYVDSGPMEYHKGRLLDPVHLRVRDVDASRRFYRAVTETLGIPFVSESESHFAVDELFVSDDGEPTDGVHLAFQAEDES